MGGHVHSSTTTSKHESGHASVGQNDTTRRYAASRPHGPWHSESAWARRIRPRHTLYKDASVHIHCNCTTRISYHPTLYEYNGSVPLFIRWIIVTNLHICCISGPACSGYRLETGRGNLSGERCTLYAPHGLDLANDQYELTPRGVRTQYSVQCSVHGDANSAAQQHVVRNEVSQQRSDDTARTIMTHILTSF